ncbi:MAG: hypothetical protein KC944_10800, partial [Candidatus Omnitrophica bacterium]|nr:hypothetical protein [Candidatus Omnitrophota bacterium]
TFTSIQTQLDQFLQHEARVKNLRQPMTQVMGDADANSVVIYGPTEEVDLLMGLIDRLDAESLYDRAPRIFFLEKAQAQEVATLLQQILLSGRGRRSADAPRIQAYPETNSIVVIASEPDIKRVEGLIADLDKGKQTGVETRVFPLKNANPQDLLQVLSPLVGQPAKLSADTQARIIIYTDTPANLDELQSLIDQLDEISSEGELVTHVQALKNTDSSTVSNVLSQYSAQLAQRKGRRTPLTQVFPDPVSNSVTVVGPTDEVSLMKDLIGELDAESLREREIEIYYLERASATDAAREINQLMAQLSRGPNAPRVGTNLESNALVVVATPADLIIIERIIEGIDSDLAGLRRTEVIPLEHADAQTLYQTLSQMAGPGGTLTVHADSNSVVYTDTEANIQKMKKIIEDLDAESQMDNVVQKVVTLKNTNATSITTPLQNIISQVSGFQAKGSKPPTQVYPEVEANAVVIVGASEDVSQLSRIVSELDSEAMYNREPVIVFLERARARDVAQELQQLFTLQRSNRTPPRIVANEWANALMVVADPQDAEMIEKIAVQLDTSEGNKRVVEIFVLENSDASALAEKLRALFQEGGRTTGNNRRSYYGYYGYSSGRRSEGLTEGEIGVTADLRLNALIVTAEPQDMDQVKELIELLDMESPFSGEPKVYSLKNAEAEAIAETLNDLFSDTDFVRNRYYTESRDVTVSGLSGRVRVMAVPQTNSIIVLASSPSAFETVEELIDELDVPNERAGKTQVIKVDNADVTSLKKTLEDLFKPEEQNNTNRSLFFFDDFFGGNGGAGGDSFSNLIGKVRIQADTRTSSLLVVTPEVYFPAVQHIVETLDVPTKQVMLKVLIAEITRRNQRDLGFQWGVDPDTGEVGQISINNTEIFNFDNDRGDTYSPLTSPIDLITTGGFTDAAQFFTLNQTQFGTVINFLQSCQDVAVKQSPMIIAADNERAYIKVGQRTPFVSDISAVGGQVNSSVEYQDIGLSLEVTPKINSETTVTLSIKLTDGAIDPTIPLLSGVAATFTDREIETSPIVQNRNTVVLGGVIFDRENEIIDEVPFLHRLPVVGDKVFTNRAKNKETVELITFITPYILNDEEDATMATEMVRQKSNDQDLKRSDLKNGDWPVEYVEEGDSGSAWPGR